MPRQVQDVHRYSGVDDGRTPNAPWLETVFPGARKEGDRLARAEFGYERTRELVNVLSDARPLDERRTIVEQDAHGGSS
jgi:hypothetical protein